MQEGLFIAWLVITPAVVFCSFLGAMLSEPVEPYKLALDPLTYGLFWPVLAAVYVVLKFVKTIKAMYRKEVGK